MKPPFLTARKKAKVVEMNYALFTGESKMFKVNVRLPAK